MKEARQRPYGVGAATEAEQEYPVAVLVTPAQEAVAAEHVLIEPGAGRNAQHASGLLLEPSPGALQPDGADPRMIIDPLLLVLVEHAKEVQDIGGVGAGLVSRAVAANDDVFRHATPT